MGPTVSLGGGGVVRPEVHCLLLIAGDDTVKDLVLGLGLPPPTACGTLVAASRALLQQRRVASSLPISWGMKAQQAGSQGESATS